MKYSIAFKCFAAIIYFAGSVIAEVTYLPRGGPFGGVWKSDSLFVGAEIECANSVDSVKVKLVYSSGAGESSLYFVARNGSDSSFLLFRAPVDIGSISDSVANLGVHDGAEPLVFKCVINEGNEHQRVLYTGQNREGVDSLVSTKRGMFGYRWAVVGQVAPALVEVGFEYYTGNTFRRMVFEVSGANIKR